MNLHGGEIGTEILAGAGPPVSSCNFRRFRTHPESQAQVRAGDETPTDRPSRSPQDTMLHAPPMNRGAGETAVAL
jgi:hypothetical protein